MAYIKNPVQAVSYCKFRPSPPSQLIQKIISFLKAHDKVPLGRAIDVGCGSGQSTEVLAPYFQQVIGIDNSKEQLQQARDKNKHQNVSYRLGSAEKLEEPDGSVDLVTAGMALHWFDLSKFYAEVGRVLKPGGALAVYGYNLPRPTVSDICLADTVQVMVRDTLGQYIPDGSRLAYFDGYKGQQFSKFPFSSQPVLRFEFSSVNETANITDLIGYISTTSAFQNYMLEHGETEALALMSNFKTKIAEELGPNTSLEDTAFNITFPYFLLLSRKDL